LKGIFDKTHVNTFSLIRKGDLVNYGQLGWW